MKPVHRVPVPSHLQVQGTMKVQRMDLSLPERIGVLDNRYRGPTPWTFPLRGHAGRNGHRLSFMRRGDRGVERDERQGRGL